MSDQAKNQREKVQAEAGEAFAADYSNYLKSMSEAVQRTTKDSEQEGARERHSSRYWRNKAARLDVLGVEDRRRCLPARERVAR